MLQPIKHIDVEHGVAESPRMTQIERLKLLNATLTAGTTKIGIADTSATSLEDRPEAQVASLWQKLTMSEDRVPQLVTHHSR